MGHGYDRASPIRHCITTPLEVSTKDRRIVRTEVKTGRQSLAESNVTNRASSKVRYAISHPPRSLQGRKRERMIAITFGKDRGPRHDG